METWDDQPGEEQTVKGKNKQPTACKRNDKNAICDQAPKNDIDCAVGDDDDVTDDDADDLQLLLDEWEGVSLAGTNVCAGTGGWVERVCAWTGVAIQGKVGRGKERERWEEKTGHSSEIL